LRGATDGKAGSEARLAMLASMVPAPPARRFSALGALLACMLAMLPQPWVAAAQPDAPQAELALVRQPAWHEPGDRLDIVVRISNRGAGPLDDFRLVVGVEDRVSSRSALHDSFTGGAGPPPSSFPRFFSGPVAAGQRRIVSLRDRVTELDLLRLVSDGGVYPLSIRLEALTEDGAVELDTLNVPLVYYPDEPQSTLKLALLVPLNEVPTQDPNGAFRPDPLTRALPLEAAVSESGWLTGLVDGLRAGVRTGLDVAVAPTPRLIEEIAAMSDGYQDFEIAGAEAAASGPQQARRWLASLRSLLRSRKVQRVLVPYAFPDLPLLERSYGEFAGSEQVERQIAVGQRTLVDLLDTNFSRSWMLPPAGRVDAATIDGLSLAGVGHVFGSDDSFRESAVDPRSGCPEESQSFTCPVRIATATGGMRGYVSDPGLQERFAALAAPGEDRLDLQRLIAETAMIREEAPTPTGRVVQATVPSLWRPRPGVSRRLFEDLARAPWLEPVTPRRGLQVASEVRARPVVDALPPAPEEPPAGYWRDLASTDELTEHFAAIEPPPALRQRLRRAILVAQSRSWWMAPEAGLSGGDFVSETADAVNRELGKISFIGKSEIVLTSREAPIQLVLSNDTGYPVTLGVDLYSEKLEVDDNSFNRSFDPGTRAIEVDAVAQTSGTFPLNARIVTPEISDERHQIDTLQIQVRSTDYNVIALGLTIGALVFLVVYYSIRALRRYERNRAAGPATS
jgi:hypothetical protein